MKLLDRILVKVGWPFARLFVAGKTAEDALRVAKKLNEQGLEAIINFLGEEVKSWEQARLNVKVYKDILEKIHIRKLRARVSIKPSQLGLRVSQNEYWHNLWEVGRNAFIFDIPLEIDMETEDTVSATIEATIESKKYFTSPLFGEIDLRQCLAMNFKESFDHFFDLTQADVKVRLCKGAYKSSISDKNEIKGRFRSAASYLLRQKADFDSGTHDTDLLRSISVLEDEWGPASYGSQFLFGLYDLLGLDIVCSRIEQKKGKKIEKRIYLPFGDNWLPYAKRRREYLVKKIPLIIGNIIRRPELLKILAQRILFGKN